MSRTKPTDFERAELRVPCSRCWARVGDWCINSRKQLTTYLHMPRMDEALRRGHLPLQSVNL